MTVDVSADAYGIGAVVDDAGLAGQRYAVVGALSFDYGSKHNHKEIPFAAWHSQKLGIPHRNRRGFQNFKPRQWTTSASRITAPRLFHKQAMENIDGSNTQLPVATLFAIMKKLHLLWANQGTAKRRWDQRYRWSAVAALLSFYFLGIANKGYAVSTATPFTSHEAESGALGCGQAWCLLLPAAKRVLDFVA